MRLRFLDWLWHRRSWKGKLGVIALALVLFITAIGLAVPAESEPEGEPGTTTAEAQEATTGADATQATPTATEETTTEEEAAPPPLLVARVIDGDTVHLDNGDRVRLVQIDAPERKGECYGRKSAQLLRRLLPVDAEVRVVRDRRLDNVDRFGRLLRYVFSGKKNINLVLVQRGAASVWFFEGDRGRHATKLLRAAENARDAGRGVWGACEASLTPERAFQTSQKQPEPEPEPQPANCHPSYEGACLDPSVSDYDCAGGSGDGPAYVSGPVRIVGPDDYGLDRDGDGVACESN